MLSIYLPSLLTSVRGFFQESLGWRVDVHCSFFPAGKSWLGSFQSEHHLDTLKLKRGSWNRGICGIRRGVVKRKGGYGVWR